MCLVPCLTNDKTGWFARRSKSVDSTKSRGNYCFKFFDVKQKTSDEVKDYCHRYTSFLITSDILNSMKLKQELLFVIEKKLRPKPNFNEVFGLNKSLQGMIYTNNDNLIN